VGKNGNLIHMIVMNLSFINVYKIIIPLSIIKIAFKEIRGKKKVYNQYIFIFFSDSSFFLFPQVI